MIERLLENGDLVLFDEEQPHPHTRKASEVLECKMCTEQSCIPGISQAVAFNCERALLVLNPTKQSRRILRRDMGSSNRMTSYLPAQKVSCKLRQRNQNVVRMMETISESADLRGK